MRSVSQRLSGRALVVALLFALIGSTVGLGAGVRIAAAATPVITVTPSKMGSGQVVVVDGSGFDPGTTVNIWFDFNGNSVADSGERSTSAVTNGSGAFSSATITVLSSPGKYFVRAEGPAATIASAEVSVGTCWIQDVGCTINGSQWICLVGDAPSEMISDCKSIDANYSDTTAFPNGYDFTNVGPRFAGAGVLAAAAVSINPLLLSGCAAMLNAIVVATSPPFNNVVPDQNRLVLIACGIPLLGIPPLDLSLYGTASLVEAALPGGHGLPDAAIDDAAVIAAAVAAAQAAALVPGVGAIALAISQQALAAAAVDGAIACGFVAYWCNGSDITANIISHPALQAQLMPFKFGDRWGDLIGWATVACTSHVKGSCETSGTLPVPGTAGINNVTSPEVCATGKVNGLSIGYDGDIGFDVNDSLVDPKLGPGPGIAPLTNYHNFEPGPGGSESPSGLDIEVPLADRGAFQSKLDQLRIGSRVTVCGRWVADMHQFWNELHPMTSLTILESTPPVITPIVTGTVGANGWYTSDVQVSWSVVDPESAITSRTGCDPTTISADTAAAGTTLTCSATSEGGPATQSVTVKLDKTKPTISAAGAPPANGAGWNNSDVTVHFTCADALSGIPAAACPADQVLGSEGAAVSSTAQTVTDAAGNVSDLSNVVTVKLDKTRPSVAVTGVSNGAQYVSGAVPVAGCQTSDALSGVATSATVAVTTTGTNGVGSFTAVCTGAIDVAGNQQAAPVSATYSVVYGFGGFLSPLPKSTLAKSGSTIPVKFRLTNAQGQPIANTLAAALAAAGNVQATLTGPNIAPVTAICSWDIANLFFQCNIKTPSGILSGRAYQIFAYERLGTTFVVAPPVGSTVNPEIVYFK